VNPIRLDGETLHTASVTTVPSWLIRNAIHRTNVRAWE